MLNLAQVKQIMKAIQVWQCHHWRHWSDADL